LTLVGCMYRFAGRMHSGCKCPASMSILLLALRALRWLSTACIDVRAKHQRSKPYRKLGDQQEVSQPVCAAWRLEGLPAIMSCLHLLRSASLSSMPYMQAAQRCIL
jgi:hypothetical protein